MIGARLSALSGIWSPLFCVCNRCLLGLFPAELERDPEETANAEEPAPEADQLGLF